jgi:hypothetical protein
VRFTYLFLALLGASLALSLPACGSPTGPATCHQKSVTVHILESWGFEGCGEVGEDGMVTCTWEVCWR